MQYRVVARTARLVATLCAYFVLACEGSPKASGEVAEAIAGAPSNDEPLVPHTADTTGCIPAREPQGSGVFEGDVTLSKPSDVAAIADFAEIRGSLRILPTYAGVVDLPSLQKLGGDLHVDDPLSPAIESIQLTSLRVPNLQRIDGELWIYLALKLTELDLHSLESVAGRVFIMRNLSLRIVRLDRLTAAGGVIFSAQTSLPSCATEAVPVLTDVTLANGSADTDCHCESPCGYPQARCD